jgi:FkbM family methyltransferase
MLLSNLTLNGFEERVCASNVAVSDRCGPAELRIADVNKGAHSLFATEGQQITIQATTLGTVFARRAIEKCRVLKIDAEGAEYPILYSSSPDLLARIDMISCEYHDLPDVSRSYDHVQLGEFLDRHGFHVSFHKPPFAVLHAVRDRSGE